MFIDQLRKDLLHFTGVDLPIHMDTQALPGMLIDDVEHSQFAPSPRRVMNKIPRPDMPTMLTLGRKSRRYALSPSEGASDCAQWRGALILHDNGNRAQILLHLKLHTERVEKL